MKSLIRSILVATLLAGSASSARAASILLDQCNTVGLCGQVGVTTTLVGNAIDVDVFDVAGEPVFGLFGASGANRSFGFNVVDPDAGVAISNVTAGFSFAPGVHSLGGGFGDYEYVINGPGNGASAILPLHFQVTRTGGFTSDLQLFEANALGYYFNAHVRNNGTGLSGWATTKDLPRGGDDDQEVPEPASLALLGMGLGATALKLRKRA